MTGKAIFTTAQARNIRILLIDDHPLVRRGLAEVIGREPDLEVCGEPPTWPSPRRGRSHSARHRGDRPDPQDGPRNRTARKAQNPCPSLKTLVSSMHDETLFAERVLRARRQGFVTKQERRKC